MLIDGIVHYTNYIYRLLSYMKLVDVKVGKK